MGATTTALVALADELDDARNNLRTIRDGLITRRINYWETSHLFDAKIGVGIDRLLAALSVDFDNITKLRDAAYDLAAANDPARAEGRALSAQLDALGLDNPPTI